jgi:hypothetical protein
MPTSRLRRVALPEMSFPDIGGMMGAMPSIPPLPDLPMLSFLTPVRGCIACGQRCIEADAVLGAFAWSVHLPTLALLVVGPLASAPLMAGLMFASFALTSLLVSAVSPLLLQHLPPRTLILISCFMRMVSSVLNLAACDWARTFEGHGHRPESAAARAIALLFGARLLHGISSVSFVVGHSWLDQMLPHDDNTRAQAMARAHAATLMGTMLGPGCGCVLAACNGAGGTVAAARAASWAVILTQSVQVAGIWRYFEIGASLLPSAHGLIGWDDIDLLLHEAVAPVCASGSLVLSASASIESSLSLVLSSAYGWEAKDAIASWFFYSAIAPLAATSIVGRLHRLSHTSGFVFALLCKLLGALLCVSWFDPHQVVGWINTLAGMLALGVGNSVALASLDALLTSSLHPSTHAKVARLLQLSCQVGRAIGPIVATSAFAFGTWLVASYRTNEAPSTVSVQPIGQTSTAGSPFALLGPNLALLSYGALGVAGLTLILQNVDALQHGLEDLSVDTEHVSTRSLTHEFDHVALTSC